MRYDKRVKRTQRKQWPHRPIVPQQCATTVATSDLEAMGIKGGHRRTHEHVAESHAAPAPRETGVPV